MHFHTIFHIGFMMIVDCAASAAVVLSWGYLPYSVLHFPRVGQHHFVSKRCLWRFSCPHLYWSVIDELFMINIIVILKLNAALGVFPIAILTPSRVLSIE